MAISNSVTGPFIISLTIGGDVRDALVITDLMNLFNASSSWNTLSIICLSVIYFMRHLINEQSIWIDRRFSSVWIEVAYGMALTRWMLFVIGTAYGYLDRSAASMCDSSPKDQFTSAGAATFLVVLELVQVVIWGLMLFPMKVYIMICLTEIGTIIFKMHLCASTSNSPTNNIYLAALNMVLVTAVVGVLQSAVCNYTAWSNFIVRRTLVATNLEKQTIIDMLAIETKVPLQYISTILEKCNDPSLLSDSGCRTAQQSLRYIQYVRSIADNVLLIAAMEENRYVPRFQRVHFQSMIRDAMALHKNQKLWLNSHGLMELVDIEAALLAQDFVFEHLATTTCVTNAIFYAANALLAEEKDLCSPSPMAASSGRPFNASGRTPVAATILSSYQPQLCITVSHILQKPRTKTSHVPRMLVL